MFRKKKPPESVRADYIVVGLGNPGKKYEFTRHNVGFLATELLAKKLGGDMRSVKCRSLYTVLKHRDLDVLIMKPQTYMNLSGEAVRDMAQAFSVPPERIIAVFDDADLAEGRLRIRASGSAGGHNGIKNMIYHLESDIFPRVKIGIGRPTEQQGQMVDHVLGAIPPELHECITRAPEAILAVIDGGPQSAMQVFNGKNG